MTKSSLSKTDRSTVKRLPQRGLYDRELIYQILDEGLICHVGFSLNHQPFVIPMAYGRKDDLLYLHGASASRLLQALQTGVEACVNVTLLDGLVVARSVFHHSMNYRSVILFGKASLIESTTEKTIALKTITNHIIADRWSQARTPNVQELKATKVLAFPIVEGSAKRRTGAPKDSPEDYSLPIWAGELPFQLTADKPIADSQLNDAIIPPDNILNYSRNGI